MQYIYTVEYYSALKIDNAIYCNMNATEIITLSKISQKDKYHDIIYMWNLKYDTNEPTYETEKETYRLVVAKGMGVEEGWTGSLGLADANWYI